MRVALSVVLCMIALTLGFLTACRAAKNRARGAELNADQRWCETISRQNALLRREVIEREWALLEGRESQSEPNATSPEVTQ